MLTDDSIIIAVGAAVFCTATVAGGVVLSSEQRRIAQTLEEASAKTDAKLEASLKEIRVDMKEASAKLEASMKEASARTEAILKEQQSTLSRLSYGALAIVVAIASVAGDLPAVFAGIAKKVIPGVG